MFIVIGSFVVFLGLQTLPVYHLLKSAYNVPGISTGRSLELFFQYVFEPFTYISLYQQIIVVLLGLMTALNILLFIIFIRRQKKVFVGKSFFASVSGIFLGLFGVGCVSCGVVILAPVLTFLGLGSVIQDAVIYSPWISGVGVLLMGASIFYILRKLSQPLVCR